jgi:hypothetical protein
MDIERRARMIILAGTLIAIVLGRVDGFDPEFRGCDA